MGAVKVLVAEDNAEQREKLMESLNHQKHLQVVGAAENGVEAMQMIAEHMPEVLVCDMVMPQLDGFGVLEEVSHIEASHRPKVIALTALSRDDFITRAIGLGASYYMVKPADTDFLTDLIMSLAGQSTAEEEIVPEPATEESAEQAVADMLLHMGVPAHLNGYRFLLRSVLESLEHPEQLGSITRALYPAVARYYNTTASRVERSIRHAIEMTWTRSGAPVFEKVLNYRAFSMDDKPTNCELIALLSERVRLQRWV